MSTTFLHIPQEVITQIFLLALPKNKCPALNEVPLNVTHTNHVLREIACSSSLLWTHLNVHLNKARKGSWEKLLELWIQRSGNAPLQYDFDFSGQYTGQQCTEMLKLLIREQSRWHSIKISGFLIYTICGINNRQRLSGDSDSVPMPLLRQLILASSGHSPFSFTKYDFSSSTLLQVLSIRQTSSQWMWTSQTISSQKLRRLSLELDESSLCDCIAALKVSMACPNLKHLKIEMHERVYEFGAEDSTDNPFSQPNEMGFVTLNHLETLHLTSELSKNIILKLLTPALKSLAYFVGMHHLPSLYTFLQNSKPPLEELRFGDYNMSEGQEVAPSIYPSVFRLLPKLKKLHISEGTHLPLAMWPAFLPNETSGDIPLPELRELKLTAPPDHLGTDFDTFADMLVRRWNLDNEFAARIEGASTFIEYKSINHPALQECIDKGFKFDLVVFGIDSAEEEEFEDEEWSWNQEWADPDYEEFPGSAFGRFWDDDFEEEENGFSDEEGFPVVDYGEYDIEAVHLDIDDTGTDVEGAHSNGGWGNGWEESGQGWAVEQDTDWDKEQYGEDGETLGDNQGVGTWGNDQDGEGRDGWGDDQGEDAHDEEEGRDEQDGEDGEGAYAYEGDDNVDGKDNDNDYDYDNDIDDDDDDDDHYDYDGYDEYMH